MAKVRHFLLFMGFLALSGMAVPVSGEPGESPQKEDSAQKEQVEKSGFVRREKSNLDWNRWMGDQILVLNCPEESFTLLRGNDKRVLTQIEKLVGKEVTVKGERVPGNRRHPRNGIRVRSFVEIKRELLSPTLLPDFSSPREPASGTPKTGSLKKSK